MKTKLYNQSAQEIGEINLPERVFNISRNRDLIYQAANVERKNQRQVLAHAKGRSEVRGGGKKPWQQKGTGRARHGSIRSPLWKGGGVTHGPHKERVFARKINQKMKHGALRALLSEKARNSDLKMIETLSISNPKTKEAAALFAGLLKNGNRTGRAMLLIPEHDKMLERAVKNLHFLTCRTSREVSVLDLLNHRFLIMTSEALAKLEARLTK